MVGWSVVAGGLAVGAAPFEAFAHFGLGEPEFYLVAPVYFLEAGGLFLPQLGVEAVNFGVAFGDAFFEPFDLLPVVFVFGGLRGGVSLPQGGFAGEPPLQQLQESLHASDGAYYGEHVGLSLIHI